MIVTFVAEDLGSGAVTTCFYELGHDKDSNDLIKNSPFILSHLIDNFLFAAKHNCLLHFFKKMQYCSYFVFRHMTKITNAITFNDSCIPLRSQEITCHPPKKSKETFKVPVF